MTNSRVILGLGGTNVLALPSFARRAYLEFARLLGIRWFDTALYYGESMELLSKARAGKATVVTKIGLSGDHGPQLTPEARWSKGFPPSKVTALVKSSAEKLANFPLVYVLLHLPIQNLVEPQIAALLDLRQDSSLTGIGFSCDEPSHLLEDISWCDLVVCHHSLLENFSQFAGVVAVHGVFRAGLTRNDLRQITARLSKATKVVFLAGTSNPFRLIKSAMMVRRLS